MKPIKIIEVKSEIGARTHGASLGIEAIEKIASDKGSDFFMRHNKEVIQDNTKDSSGTFSGDHAHNIQSTLQVCECIASSVKKALDEEMFPLVVSSDHSTALGTIAGVKMAHPSSRIAVIWIDAHADLHSPYTTPTGNMHGMPVLASLGEDNIPMKVNTVDEVSLQYWERCKAIGGISKKIEYEDLVYIGLRDYEEQEKALLLDHNICVIRVDEINTIGLDAVVLKTLSTISKHDYIYISFDADSLDPSVSKGTGISVPNGLTEEFAGNLIASLMKDKRVCCLEITEVNPMLDQEKPMEEVAFNIIQKALGQFDKYF